jgi:hypothetical protein
MVVYEIYLYTRYMPMCCIGIIFFGLNLIITRTQTRELRGFGIRRGHVDPVFILEPSRMRVRELRGG